MVKYETILKVIEDDITKSHQHLTLYKPLLPKFNKFHEQTCITKRFKKEKAYICDNNGKEIFTKLGSQHRISMDLTTIKDLYEDYGELNFTHNHPSIGQPIAECLSSADVSFLMETIRVYDEHEGWSDDLFPVKSMSCESPNGSRMTLVRGDFFKKENTNEMRRLGKDLENLYSEYIEEASKTGSEILHSDGAKNTNMDLHTYIEKETNKKIGRFEDWKEFKDIQSKMRKLDCRLEMTYPYEYPY